IHNDIQSVADLNPWLDQQAAEQRAKLNKARELILELYKEVDISREERLSDYMRQLSEVMAFEKEGIEEVTGEMELQMETALEEMESRLAELEKAIEAVRRESGAVGKVGAGIAELSKSVKEMNSRLDKIEASASKDSGAEKLQASFKELSRSFRDIEKEFNSSQTDASEIKETVLRDSKRTYNLNERVTDLERLTANTKKDAGKDSMAAVRALEGRLNVLDKAIKDMSRKRAQPEVNAKPVVIESPVVETVETKPGGTTVKKTVKRTTTKKTTRSK
ncbi:MAG: hypothetical protein R6W91_07460, partial [Thermoplasmata archaeon]